MERVYELEVKLAFAESRLLDLDDVVRDLADRVVELERQVKSLQQRVEAEDLPSTAPEKPPHY